MVSRRVPVPFVLAAVLCLPAAPARSDTSVASGLGYANKGGYHVVIADLDSKTIDVRVARPNPDPKKNKRTVAQHGEDEGAVVAINANYFGGPDNHPCGAARGYGAQYPGIYAEAVNCVTSLGWSKGKGEVFISGGQEQQAGFKPQYTEVVTGGGYLLLGGLRADWNHKKLAAGRGCTAVGLSKDRGKIILVVTDNKVCTGKGLQDALLDAGAADAIHLDGGGSAKMWVRGRGYVNNVAGARQPPVAIVVKAAAEKASTQCPSICGSAPCVQLPAPYGAQCLGKSCRGALGSGWRCDSAQRYRVRCEGGVVVRHACAMACRRSRGAHDSCPRCPSGNGLYCGGNPVIGDPGVLYRCRDGLIAGEQRCAGGCARMPAGTNDQCR